MCETEYVKCHFCNERFDILEAEYYQDPAECQFIHYCCAKDNGMNMCNECGGWYDESENGRFVEDSDGDLRYVCEYHAVYEDL